MADCLAHVGLAAATLLAWFGLGSVVFVRGPRVGDPLLHLVNRVGAGVLCFALLTFAAGWLGLLYRTAYLSVFVASALVGAAACVTTARMIPRPHLRGWATWQLVLLALLVAYVALDVLAVCAPISSPDALLYHAADPALFDKAHRIFEVP